MKLKVESNPEIPSLTVGCRPTNLTFTIEIRHGRSYGYCSEEDEREKIYVPPHDYMWGILGCRDQLGIHERAKFHVNWELENCFEVLLDRLLKEIKAKAMQSNFAKSFRIQREQLNQKDFHAL
jgi:hypothetical protein